MKKRIISLLLAALMIVGLLPMTVLADEACAHTSVEPVYTANADKTHAVSYLCADCGEEIPSEEEAVVVDFMDFAKNAPQQDWWAGLKDASTAGVKVQGSFIDGAVTEEYTAAYTAMNAWLAENTCWSIDESNSSFTNSGRLKNFYINSNADANWGVRFVTYYQNWGAPYSEMLLKVVVPAAGTYDMSVAYPQDWANGGFTMFVNGEQVGEQVVVSGAPLAQPLTKNYGTVELQEGVNTVGVRITACNNGTTADYVTTQVELSSIAFAPVSVNAKCSDTDEDGKCDGCAAVIGTCKHEAETTITDNGDKTHTISAVCAKCGEAAAIEERAVNIDFVDFAAKASEQTWWGQLQDATIGAGIKQYGYTAMSDTATAAYNAMIAWQQENLCWSISEAGGSDFSNSGRAKNLYINANDDAAWGVRFTTYYMTWGDVFNQLLLNVDVPAAGTYDLSLDYLQGAAYGCFTVFVNGEQVGEEICANGDSENKTASLGKVTLNEGANQIAIKITGNRDGSEASYVTVEVALCAINLAPISVTGACADLTGEGECDVCGAVIASCKHVELEETVTDNGDKTHTVSYICAACGEAVADRDNTLSMDFKAFAKAAANKSFWEDLVAVSDGVKNYGGSVTAANTAAYKNMLSWQGENFDWAIVEAVSDYTNPGRNKKVILNANDSDDWGINFYTYYNDWAGVYNVFKMAVYATEPGTYELNLGYVQTTCGGSFTVSVNGEQIGEEIATVGAVESKSVCLGNVELVEGENIVDVILTKNFQGTTTRLSSDMLLNAMDFVPVSVAKACADDNADTLCDVCDAELGCKHTATTAVSVANGDGTHTTTYTCASCGEAVASNEATISMDFMAAAKKAKAEKPEMMAKLRQSNDPNVVFFGYESVADAETAGSISLFDLLAMSNWIDDNYDWNIDETKSVISDKGVYKRVYLNGADDAQWAFRFVPTMLTWDIRNRALYLKLDVAQAGTYTMDFEYLQHAAAGVDLTNSGAKVDILVNDVVVYEGLETDGATQVKNLIVENVELVKGENIIAIAVTANKDGGVTNVNTSVDIRKIDFAPSAITVACYDGNGDGACDTCAEDYSCKHTNTTTEYIDNGDGTHEVTVICGTCGETTDTYVEDCMDEDADGYCDACDAVLETPCDHSNTSETVVPNADKTHTVTVTCQCGEVVSEETVDCADEDKDTACDACGATLVTITKFTAAGSNMTLGNELVVNVMFMKNKITGEGNTIEITHGDAVTTVAQADWESYNSAMYVARIPVAAKEMADNLTVVIKNAEGYEISTAYTTSVREYAGKVLSGSLSTYSQLMKNLAVDMLNYGAAAQTNFSYNTGDMANKLLTAEQAGWATADVTCTNNQVKGAKCAGSNLSLESKILLNIIFQLSESAAADKYAMVTYTDYTGKAVEYRVDAFNRFNASMQGVVIDEIVLADAFQLVTVTIYNADGTTYGYGSDSVESYAARTSNALNAAIMKFASSAKTYLSK